MSIDVQEPTNLWQAVLDDARRYRLFTAEAIKRKHLPDASEHEVETLTRKLKGRGLIESHSLYGMKHYICLAPAGARALAVNNKHAGPLGPQAIPQRFGCLHYCLLRDQITDRITPDELEENFPDYHIPTLRSNYVIEEIDGKLALVHLIVDLGADPVRLLKKARKCIMQRRGNPHLRALITSGRFVITFVTPTREKGVAIERAAKDTPVGVPIRHHVVDELVHMILRRKP